MDSGVITFWPPLVVEHKGKSTGGVTARTHIDRDIPTTYTIYADVPLASRYVALSRGLILASH